MKVKARLGVGVLVVMALWLLAGGVRAEETRPSAEYAVDVFSQYIWRGFAFSDDSVVIQPSMTVSYLGAYINVWGNYDTDRNNEHDRGLDGADWNETDFTFGYAYDLPYGILLDVGGIYYALEGDDSFELYLGLSATCPRTGINFGLTVYRELSHYPGWWYEISAGRDFTLPWRQAILSLSVSAMYLDSDDKGAYGDPDSSGYPDNPGEAFSGWLYMQLGAEVSFPIGKFFAVTPKIYYSFSLSDDADDLLEDISWDNHHDHFFAGIGFSLAF